MNGLRLLVVNWQDRENPQAGGAEVHLHEIFGRLVARGHSVTLLCSGWPGAEPHADLDGIEVHRTGDRYSFTLRARPYYRAHLSDREFDLVVEDINKIPLYTPLWVRAPVVALVPHLFGTTAFREVAFPTALAVWLSERAIPWVYRSCRFQAISESTASDLVGRGVDRSRIAVIRPGIDHTRFRPDPQLPRFELPTFAYVGRLKRYKGLEHVIDAVGRLDPNESARLIIAGKGDHEVELRRYAGRCAPDRVEFRGYVSASEKIDLLRRAWATVYPSPKEGWGITNIESAACGTPAIASDAPGLRESVEDGRSGLLVPHASPEAWAAAFRDLIRDPALRHRLSQGAQAFARQFSWERTAEETEAHLKTVADGTTSRADGQTVRT